MTDATAELTLPCRTATASARGAGQPRPRGLGAYLLLLPSLVCLSVFTYFPVIEAIYDSLQKRIGIGKTTAFSGLDNYVAILGDKAFRRALWNNAIYAIGTLIPTLVLALGFAMALQRASRINALLRAVFFLPVLIPLIAAAALFLFIFLPGVGLIDYQIGRFLTRQHNWLGDPDLALWSIILLTVWKNAGYYMLFFLAGLQAIPPDAYEATYLDGASPWQRLRHVTLPYLKPTLAFVAIIALLNIVIQVDHVFVLTKGGPSDSTNLLLFYIYQQAVESYDIGKAAAATVLSLLMLFGITFFSLGTIERSLGGGAP